MADRVQIVCPCCQTQLVVDPATGVVLSEERVKPQLSKTFDMALNEVQSGSQRREEAFSKAFDRTKQLDTLLEKKFEEARKKAAKDPSKKPRNPFDVE
jgi:hypothetical protein